MISTQSLVLTRVSDTCLMLDESQKRVAVIDHRALVKRAELQSPGGNGLRCTLLAHPKLFAGYSNGFLQCLDAETLELQYECQLHATVFCMEQLDNRHIICG